jgi:diaminopropionate ammonia-lyase
VTPTRWATNPKAREWLAPPVDESAERFHRQVRGYQALPLIESSTLSANLGVGRVWVKIPIHPLGVLTFKVLGASWAVNRALSQEMGYDTPAATLEELHARVRGNDLTLVAATSGSHGHAVARMAALLGLRARIYVANVTAPDARELIRREGAEVLETGASYDASLEQAVAGLGDGDILLQDTAVPGHEDVSRWMTDGYQTIFADLDDQLPVPPDVVVVPAGVGALTQAVVERARRPLHALAGRPDTGHRPSVLAVEPETAACVTASLAAGERVTVDVPRASLVPALDCGTVSAGAWPVLKAGLDASVAVSDAEIDRAADRLRALGTGAGMTGAAALAGVLAARDLDTEGVLRMGPESTVVILSTLGKAYAQAANSSSPSSA